MRLRLNHKLGLGWWICPINAWCLFLLVLLYLLLIGLHHCLGLINSLLLNRRSKRRFGRNLMLSITLLILLTGKETWVDITGVFEVTYIQIDLGGICWSWSAIYALWCWNVSLRGYVESWISWVLSVHLMCLFFLSCLGGKMLHLEVLVHFHSVMHEKLFGSNNIVVFPVWISIV